MNHYDFYCVLQHFNEQSKRYVMLESEHKFEEKLRSIERFYFIASLLESSGLIKKKLPDPPHKII